MSNGFYVILMAECLNDKTGKTRCLDAHFKFENEDSYNICSDNFFDMLSEPFNQWLQENGYEGWFVDDVIETDRFISEKETVNPYNFILEEC